MKTQDLKGDDLDYWTARADGFSEDQIIRPLRADGSKRTTIYTNEKGWVPGCYTKDWRLTGPLIDKFSIELSGGTGGWYAGEGAVYYDAWPVAGESPIEAICRAVVHVVFGNEVGGVPA
ncbi:hypothetical protein Q3G72_011243 [Acer saccharum]|nr:hypothetical protein Q3G72_011243 [Acer saccharum]